MVLLAVLSLASFVSALLVIFTNIDKNFSFNTPFFIERAEELKKRTEGITDEESPETQKEIEEIEMSILALYLALFFAFIWMIFRGVFFVLTLIVRKLMEPILVIWALVAGVEPAFLGLVVLAVWFSSWYINAKQAKNKELSKNWLATFYNFIPSLYLLYVFLVLTHVI